MQSLEQLQQHMLTCRLCLDDGYDIQPPAVFSGDAGARVMIIGQAPGSSEVVAGRPMNAGSGRRLFEWLGAAGWAEDDFRARHYMTSVTKCYPGRSSTGKGDRVPTRAEQAHCRPFLDQEMALVNPCLIIPVGGLAIKLFYPSRLRLDQIIGCAAYFPPDTPQNPVTFNLKKAQRFDQFDPQLSREGRWLVPLPHPSGASLWPNKPQNQALISRATEILAAIRQSWNL